MQKIEIDDFGCLPWALLILAVLLNFALNRVADSIDDLGNAVAEHQTK